MEVCYAVIRMNVTEQYFPVLLFVMLCFKIMKATWQYFPVEVLLCCDSYESY